jgi:uncharacterized protein (DUF983 family)
MDPGEEDLDALDTWRDVVDEILAGRTEGHRCPVCTEGELDCRFDGMTIRIRCRKCGRSLEAVVA